MCLGSFGWQIAKRIRDILDETISDLVKNRKDVFCNNPETDFIRERIFTPRVIIYTLLQFESRNTESELIDIFDCQYRAKNINSALLKQRAKINEGAFKHLFEQYTSNVLNSGVFSSSKPYGYDGSVYFADGSDTNIAKNENDPLTYIAQKGKKGYNQFHLNALYDYGNRVFAAAHVQGIKKKEERQALVKMVSELDPNHKALIIADRGYESYNVFAACIENNKDFLIRLKDIESNGILASHVHNLPDGEFDMYISTIVTKKRGLKTDRTQDIYTVLSSNTRFDYFDDNDEYDIGFRIVRFQLPNGEYETIATSLSRYEYDIETIMELYHERWDCETAFRKLKMTLGLVHFHSRKMKYILQELYIKLTLYNLVCFEMEAARSGYEDYYGDFYEASGTTQNDDSDKSTPDNGEDGVLYRVNLAFSQAVTACRRLLKPGWLEKITDVIETIRAHTYRIKMDRQFPRNVKPQSYRPFNHRTS